MARLHPFDEVIAAAVTAARSSVCAKSKRGVAVYYMLDGPRGKDTVPEIIGAYSNGPPPPFECSSYDGDGRCERICNQWAVHAEARAVRRAVEYRGNRSEFRLLHVKVENGELVAGGPPSCWQCSREILDAGLHGIWLYERKLTVSLEYLLGVSADAQAKDVTKWSFYSAEEFHRVTWENQP
ncbi:MAG TPA: hypothetical protein VGM94_01225 [Galbitalea sp.]|jgi:hypothetical protein